MSLLRCAYGLVGKPQFIHFHGGFCCDLSDLYRPIKCFLYPVGVLLFGSREEYFVVDSHICHFLSLSGLDCPLRFAFSVVECILAYMCTICKYIIISFFDLVNLYILAYIKLCNMCILAYLRSL